MNATRSSSDPALPQSPRRRPAWLPIVAMLAVLPVLLWLGTWQLQRAEQKRELFERFGAEHEPVALTDVLTIAPQALRYRRVFARGRYEAQRQFLLEGMTHEGRPGLHVLTPFVTDTEAVVLVNRGWIPETRTRDTRPPLPVADASREIAARIVPYPEPGLRLAAPTPEQADWPRRVLYPTPQQIETALGRTVAPHMLWLDADQPDGFVRSWKPAEFGPARHVGYAVQWFGLAVTLVLIYMILRFRRRHDG